MAGPLWPGHCFLPVWIRSPIHTGNSQMLFGLVDRSTSATSLKGALDRSVERSRGIADRVSKASVQNGDGFALEAKSEEMFWCASASSFPEVTASWREDSSDMVQSE